jgi:hypothetical protein
MHMPQPAQVTQVRRATVGILLIVAPLVALVGALLVPQFTGGMEGELAHIGENPNQWLLSNLLNLVSFFLFIPALLGLTHLFRHRAVVLGHLGASLAVLGLYFHGALIGYSLVQLPLVESGWDAVAFSEQMYEHIAFTAILMPFMTFFLGLGLMSIALWQGRVAPFWVPAAIIVGVVSNFFAPREVSPELMFILFLLSFGWLGVKILRMSDLEWEVGHGKQSVSSDPAARPTTREH